MLPIIIIILKINFYDDYYYTLGKIFIRLHIQRLRKPTPKKNIFSNLQKIHENLYSTKINGMHL